MKRYHNATGQPGIDEIYRQISQHFYMFPLRKTITDFVNSCLICATTKVAKPQEKANQKPNKSERSWQVISVDVMGPCPVTATGNKYPILVSDCLSKWVEAKATPKSNGRSIVDIVKNEVFNKWDYPETIISDNASQFKGITNGQIQWNGVLRKLRKCNVQNCLIQMRICGTQNSTCS